MSLSPRDAAFLLTCLRFLGAGAPCQARIEAVIASVAGTDSWRDCRVPPTVYARSLCMASVIWAIDSGLVDVDERDVAQDVLEQLWQAGPIRPDLIGAQLRCLVGQEPGAAECRWTCPAMRRANAGYAQPDGGLGRPVQPDLVWAVRSSAVTLLDDGVAGGPPSAHRPPGVLAPRRGARVTCRECGRLGTVLGVDGDDAWTVIEHHPPVVQRPDGMWEVRPMTDDGPRQCRYLARFEAAVV